MSKHPEYKSTLDVMLERAIRDRPTTTGSGAPLRRLTHGVVLREAPVHIDARGSVCEILDMRWDWHPAPIVFSYMFSVRPGYVKGWGLHKEHEDRYFLIKGECELVLFDPRPDSPTCGEICKIMMSERRRFIVNIPRFVWHADHNVGTEDAIVVNFPTAPYDHAAPDKYRLPIDTDLIPYSFGNAVGGG